MTADTPTASDLHRAAGLEKMAGAMWETWAQETRIDNPHLWGELLSIVARTSPEECPIIHSHVRLARAEASAALAAWEGHCAEIEKAPAD